MTAINLRLECFKHLLATLFYPALKVKPSFTSRDVAELTGASARQLQWWDERGIVVPARSGRRRTYSTEDIAEVAVIIELRRRGFSLQRMRKVMRFLHREFGKRLAETVTGRSDYNLLTDGKTLYLETSSRHILDILKNSRQPIMAVCLSDAVRQVLAVMRGNKKGNGSSLKSHLSLESKKAC